MRTPTTSELLNLWEFGADVQPAWRALMLVKAAYPGIPQEALEKWSIGHRDACLLAVRERLFGSTLSSTARCPRCCELLELTFDVDDIRTPSRETGQGPLMLKKDGYEVVFRLPDSSDLISLAETNDPAAARTAILDRCIVEVKQNDEVQKQHTLPDDVLKIITEKMADADPQADVQLNLACPACRYAWTIVFDILSYFWAEIDAWARRLLHEVHTLALVYGWREADILAMSPQRRQLYLEMASGYEGRP